MMEEDWDNLIVLDACRFDMLDNRDPFDDTVLSRLSPGSESWEFMEASFYGRALHDTVYVTANPHTSKLPADTFHAVINLLDQHWDDEFHTVLPNAVVEQTQKVLDRYPDKRLITHFMQPHFPFIGEMGQTLDYKGISAANNAENQDQRPHPWFTLMHDCTGDREQIIEAYMENLDVVLPYVEKLLNSLSGKTVVTADHGNLLGEWVFPIPVRVYGHPRGLHKRELIEVPWVEIGSAERRSITAESPVAHDDLDHEVLENRLSDLGYHE